VFQRFTIGGQDVVLSAYAVPEPSTWALLLSGAGLLIVIHHRRAFVKVAQV
jgi:hypothetical protein